MGSLSHWPEKKLTDIFNWKLLKVFSEKRFEKKTFFKFANELQEKSVTDWISNASQTAFSCEKRHFHWNLAKKPRDKLLQKGF